MRVLHVINGLGTGGAERSLAELLPLLDERGISGAVACLHRRTEGVQDSVIASGVDVRFVAARRLPGRARAVRRLVRELRPDVVHSTIFEADLTARVATVGTGVPVLSSLVSTPYAAERRADPNVRPWRLRAARVVEGWTARHLSSRFLAITNAVADAATRDLGIPRARIEVVERGRDRGRLGEPDPARRSRVRRDLGIDDDAEVVLHVGRQEFSKGVDLLPAIVVGLADRPRVVVLQAGRRGWASDALDAAVADHDVARRLRLLGHRGDVPDLLAAADVFVFPSRFEGLGGSLIEAMGLGVPIVASDIPAAREVLDVGGCADVVAVGDTAGFAAAVAALLDGPERRQRYGERGREVFESRFTLERSADRFAALVRATSRKDSPR